ncbi:hypothetical protein Dalk_0270 [Desulfatibacillum aliphaticivorans]|uniref:Uncharacterized protein n=1 Tax=Desulfatibacillum aliphaticivorans TaxID=218208 RepID=B8F8U7_DESAL|nr:hypothetical protein [Desulfatibacillum aliphaticivorans]ACL01979.1 hypothetical protein Dalk_0270 [Desulfatibacillum aliphaticivorans]
MAQPDLPTLEMATFGARELTTVINKGMNKFGQTYTSLGIQMLGRGNEPYWPANLLNAFIFAASSLNFVRGLNFRSVIRIRQGGRGVCRKHPVISRGSFFKRASICETRALLTPK